METKMYWMDSEGKMAERVKAPELKRGTIIWAVGFGCQTEKYAITERLANGNYKAVILDASALSRDGWFREPFTQVEEYCRPISEQFGIGCYYDLDEPKATEEGALGGRFNSHLTCGAGWIFSKAREQSLRAALSL